MAPPDTTFDIRETSMAESEPNHKEPGELLGKISHEIFRYDCLDRKLKRHHITGTSAGTITYCWLTYRRYCVLRCCRYRAVPDFRTDHCDG